MTERERSKLVFGGGLDRATGIQAIDSNAFEDLRNVYLRAGKAELTKGLSLLASDFTAGGLVSPTDIIGVHPIQESAAALILTYKASTREVYGYKWDINTATLTFVSSLGVVPAGGTLPPRYITADLNGVVYIAHDETLFAQRAITRVYDIAAGTINNPGNNFDDGTGYATQGMYFRGVARWGNYMVGWGWGDNSTPGTTDNRPEILRISMPGDPGHWKAAHYFIVGSRGQAIVGAGLAGGILAIRKYNESHKLIGTNRQNFDVLPLDRYGQLAGHLAVTVGTRQFFWANGGPRMSDGDESVSLALPLDLEGPDPDALVASLDINSGFAMYDEARDEVLFVFGQWCYKLHIGDPGAMRWSFRVLPFPLTCGATVYNDPVVA